MIHVDIGGDPTLPLPQWLYIFLVFFLWFFGSPTFKAIWGPKYFLLVIWRMRGCMAIPWSYPKFIIIGYFFPISYYVAHMDIVWKICAFEKLIYQLAMLGPKTLLALHLVRLWFYRPRFFIYFKRSLFFLLW